MNIMNFTRTILRNVLKKPVTRPYPQIPRTYPDRARGHIEIDINACIFCGMCARKCPPSTITVDKEQKEWAIEPLGCIQCGACVECCPKKCLFMLQTYTAPDALRRRDSFVQKH